MQNSNISSKQKVGNPDTGNAFDRLVNEEWKSEEDYKRNIVSLELENQKYRNELYELGETVNKILEKTKVPQSSKQQPPNLEQQLEIVRKELHNVNQFIEIYQKELNSMGGKKKQEQMDSISSTEDLLKAKNEELSNLKKEVKQISHKNKGLEYKLLEYSKRNKAKSVDQQALQLKELINENKNLKAKLEELERMQEKKQIWLKNNINSAKNLEEKVKEQQAKLPKIVSRTESREKLASIPKLQSEKKIYTKWLETSRGKSHSRIDKELEDLQKISDMVREKINSTTEEIKQIEEQTRVIREKVEANEEFVQEEIEDGKPKMRDFGCMAAKKVRKVRREWVGKFDSLRFSDSRQIREETRAYKVLFNTSGYYQFFYYSVKDKNKVYVGKLPFDTNSLAVNGKESTFTVEYPDFIKNIRLKINIRSQRVLEMYLTSNLGVQGEFTIENLQNPGKEKDKSAVKPLTSNKEDQNEILYDMDIKPNEAISCVFGSYATKTDDKKNITSVWLEGLGVELIEDFVEEAV